MSHKIKTKWECLACETKNELVCVKPRIRQSSVLGATCGLCKSEFTLKIFNAGLNQLGVMYIDGPQNKLSAEKIKGFGDLLINEMEEMQRLTGVEETPQTKEEV